VIYFLLPVLISAMNDATKELKIHTEEQVAYITLNRPERGNSLSPGMVGLLLEALENFERDRKIRVIVLRGTGKFFCSGMDLIGAASMQNDSSQFSQVADRGIQIFSSIMQHSKPVIVLLHGPALGGGVGLLFAADIRIALKDVWFQTPEVKRGIVPAFISTVITPQIGSFRAMEFLLTGKKVSAKEAYEKGYLSKVVDTPEEMQRVLQSYIEELLLCAPKAIAMTKRLIHYAATHCRDQSMEAARKAFLESVSSDEAKYGMTAFLQRQQPDWTQLQSKL
jgi:methylglutaconyl-CoA hydratase